MCADGLGQAQLRYGVGANHDLKRKEPLHQAADRLTDRSGPPLRRAFSDKVKDRQRIGAGARCRVKHRDACVAEPFIPAEFPAQNVVNQTHLAPHHLNRSIVCAGLLTQARVVCGEKILVEEQPGIVTIFLCGHEIGGYGGYHSLCDFKSRAQFLTRIGIGEPFQDVVK